MDGRIVFGVQGHQKGDGFRRYFWKGSEARELHLFTLLTISGAHWGSKRRQFWSSLALLSMSEISTIFKLKSRGSGVGPAAGAVLPEPSESEETGKEK